MPIAPKDCRPIATTEDEAAAKAADEKMVAALANGGRTGRAIYFHARAVVPKDLTEAEKKFELGELSYAALSVLADRWREAGWHVYPDHRPDGTGMLRLVEP